MSRLMPNVHNEAARLNALRDLKLLDTPPSDAFDRLTRLASQLLRMPVSTISLTDKDRQWFKSKVGVDDSSIPRERSPCSYAIGGDEVFVVHDLQADPRFAGSPLENAGVRFYAGAPLITRRGFALGTICVLDSKPNDIDEAGKRVLKDLAGLVMAQIELQNMIGRTDPTTGAPNQHQFFEDVEDMRNGGVSKVYALLIELMGPERSADLARALGPYEADEVVCAGLALLQAQSEHGARIYHVGPSRFAVVIDPEDERPEWYVRRYSEALAEGLTCGGVPIVLDAAIGIYEFDPTQTLPRDALRRLLIACAEAREGEGQAHYASEQEELGARRFALINDFAIALHATDQLSLAFQPRADLKTGNWVGAEALLRWRHPRLGNISPSEFIPLVEKTALARPLMDWVAREAFRIKAGWQAMGVPLKMSINASALNLNEPDFAQRLLRLLQVSGADPGTMELEFTESAVARDAGRVIRQMEALRAKGLAMAVDDFGTGYSNLSYLQQLPVSVLKIDQVFIRKLEASRKDQKLVQAMLGIADDLGYTVVAEGIETKESLELLRGWGCKEGQGYHIAHPMSAEALVQSWQDTNWQDTNWQGTTWQGSAQSVA